MRKKYYIVISSIVAALIVFGFWAGWHILLNQETYNYFSSTWLNSILEEVVKYSIFAIILKIIYKDHKNLVKSGALFGFVFGTVELAVKLFYTKQSQLGLIFGSFLLPIPFLTFLGFLMGYFFNKKRLWIILTGLIICFTIHWQFNELILWLDRILNP